MNKDENLLNYSVQELEISTPCLRKDIIIHIQKIKNKKYYIIEDPIKTRFYKIGEREYNFISLLNGKNKIGEIISKLAKELKEKAITIEEAYKIIQWLKECNLLDFSETEEIEIKKVEDKTLNIFEKINYIIFFKIPLGNPDKILDKLLFIFKPMLTPYFFILWGITLLYSLSIIIKKWDNFLYFIPKVIDINNWIYLVLTWLFLKIIHEIWHGLVTKKYGGEVREWGIILLVFFPLGYVDTTNCWKLRSKWQRAFISLAGIYIELFLASIGIIIWNYTDSLVLKQIAYNLALIGSIVTLFFNINPLMKFDGYYALTDILEEPNLYDKSRGYIGYLIKKYILGIKIDTSIIYFHEKVIFFIYGILSLIWRFSVYISIILGVSLLFKGIGIILSFFCIISWFLVPLYNIIKNIFFSETNPPPSFKRVISIISIFLAFIYIILFEIKIEETIEFYGIIKYKNRQEIRIYSPGFLKDIKVKTNDRVKKGQILAILENRDIKYEVEKIKIDIEKIKIKIKRNLEDNPVLTQILKKKLEYLKDRLKEELNLLHSLVIKSDIAGIIINRDLISLKGKYLKTGYKIFTIIDPNSLYIKAYVSQENIKDIKKYKNKPILFYKMNPFEKNKYYCKLNYISPNAQQIIEEKSLTSIVKGGKLKIYKVNYKSLKESNIYLLLQPYFKIECSILPKYKKNKFKEGERVILSIKKSKILLSKKIINKFIKFFNKKLKFNKNRN